MSKNKRKRKGLFDAYLHQLSLLEDMTIFNPTVPIKTGKYICPLCLDYFEESSLFQDKENPLTLEDAPPKALGGKANTLTCKRCNNTMGRVIDSQLSLKIQEFEAHKFIHGSEYNVRIKDGEERYQGVIKIDTDGKMTVLHENKNNNPNKLKDYLETVEKDKVVEVEFRLRDVNHHYLSHAILKTIYMIIFEVYGYSVILHDDTYSRIRRQLQNPDKDIYGFKFWSESEYSDNVKGVNIISEKDMESFLVIFTLKSEKTSTTVAGFLPRPPTTMPNLERMMAFRKRQGLNPFVDATRLTAANSFITDANDVKKIVHLMNNNY